MKRIINMIVLGSLVTGMLVSAGCKRSYDDPDEWRRYSRADFPDKTFLTIQQVKDLYTYSTIGESVFINEDYMVEGKVISNDKSGNIYRTMYIQDETGGLEIKIGTTNNYSVYRPGETIFVDLQGFVLGNYRYNLSIGSETTNESYANGYIDVKYTIDKKIKLGPKTSMTSADTTVITSPDQLHDGLMGRLIRIEGATSRWGTWDGDPYPQFLESVNDGLGSETAYQSYGTLEVIEQWKQYYADKGVWEAMGQQGTPPTVPNTPEPETLLYPTWSFRNIDENLSYYGTAWFEFGTPSATDPTHNLLVRSSGYAKFALQPLPVDGTVVNITAIYNKYSSRTGSYIKYQLLLNDLEDVVVVQ